MRARFPSVCLLVLVLAPAGLSGQMLSDSSCTWNACALRVQERGWFSSRRLLKGRDDELVARADRSKTLEELFSVNDSAAAHYRRFAAYDRRGDHLSTAADVLWLSALVVEVANHDTTGWRGVAETMKMSRRVAPPGTAILAAALLVHAGPAEGEGAARSVGPASDTVSAQEMRAVYEEVKTPFKYGVVITPQPGQKIDCPSVFRYGDKWYMIYVQLEKKPREGYTTQLAVSADLLHWKPLGTIGERGAAGSWDQANVGGGVALIDTEWGGSYELEKLDGRYWFSFIGGSKYGYEVDPLAIGLASTDDPSKAEPWHKLPQPIMTVDDPDARPQEKQTLYKSFIFHDENRTLGAPYVMFYNAREPKGEERIFTAVSDDMKVWRRYGSGPAVENLAPDGEKKWVISGDPQITRMGDLWVMFYFGAFWQPGAFNTFAASRDLVHWTKWEGPHLVQSSEPYDSTYAHKSWVVKHDGVVYHFYCAVGDQGRVIALATSKEMK